MFSNDDRFSEYPPVVIIRLLLPEKFGKAIERVMGASANMLMEGKWKDEALRYGVLREVGEVLVRQIE